MIPSKEDRAARALDYFHQGYNCSQSVFAAFADVCGLTEETALKLSSPLGAGIGRMREVCGAFCGLSMLAGSLYGNSSPKPEKRKIFSLVQSLAASFKQESGTLYCRELLGLSPDAYAETARPGERTAAYYASRPCERCIAFCARRAADLEAKARRHENTRPPLQGNRAL
ncbi:MAG: C-GCAxxG-C-C family protein [Akkermansia sp.]